MKKSFLFVAALMMAVAVNAQGYKASIGAAVGTFEGVSFKGFFISDNLGLIADLGYSVGESPMTEHYKYFEDGKKVSDNKYNEGSYSYFTFELNPNLVYQANIHDWDWGGISWFAGGGVSLGLMKQTKYHNAGTWSIPYENNGLLAKGIGGKWGINAIGGAEIKFAKIPLAVSLDFRPGYGMEFDSFSEKVSGVKEKETFVASFFDWKVVASVRYVF